MYTYSWFSLWKERHQIHFKFGEWSVLGHPLLPDSYRGVTVSDSGTVPGTTTTASTTDSVINDANEKSSSSSTSGSNGSGVGSTVRWRKPILTIPAPYSHRFQIITDDNNSDNNTTPTPTTANSNSINNNSNTSNSCNSKVLYGTRYYFPPPVISSSSEKEGEKEVDEGEGNKEWLCIYAYK